MPEDVIVVYANTHAIDRLGEEEKLAEEFPFKVEAVFRHSDFMIVTAILLYGGSEVIMLRAKTLRALCKAIRDNGWMDHPRRTRVTISGPDLETKDYGRGDALPGEKETACP